MTHEAMQQIIMSSLTDRLSDTLDMRTRVSKAFGVWFRALVDSAPQPLTPEQQAAPPEGELPPPTDAPEVPPPTGTPV